MANDEFVQCKTKGCNNPVLVGKYCQYCKQKNKEIADTATAIGSSVLLGGGVYAVKKGVFKNVPKKFISLVRMILRK